MLYMSMVYFWWPAIILIIRCLLSFVGFDGLAAMLSAAVPR